MIKRQKAAVVSARADATQTVYTGLYWDSWCATPQERHTAYKLAPTLPYKQPTKHAAHVGSLPKQQLMTFPHPSQQTPSRYVQAACRSPCALAYGPALGELRVNRCRSTLNLGLKLLLKHRHSLVLQGQQQTNSGSCTSASAVVVTTKHTSMFTAEPGLRTCAHAPGSCGLLRHCDHPQAARICSVPIASLMHCWSALWHT
jgi:hypothetical protein